MASELVSVPSDKLVCASARTEPAVQIIQISELIGVKLLLLLYVFLQNVMGPVFSIRGVLSFRPQKVPYV